MNRQDRRAALATARRRYDLEWIDVPLTDLTFERYPSLRNMRRALKNDVYSVQVYVNRTAWGEVEQLTIRRHDAQPIHQWSELQRIKNEIAGENRTAVEVYPATADVVDQANLYHLWVLPVGFELPFGLHKTTGFGGWGSP